jgi:hypothetical protein
MDLPDRVWARHANPKSGWSRVALLPLFALGLYRRDLRLLAAAVGWTVLNPVVFPPPADAESWMTRGVLAERAWLAEGNPTVGLGWPNVLNLASGAGSAYLVWAALRRRPFHTALATVVVAGAKLRWIAEIIELTGTTTDSELPARE